MDVYERLREILDAHPSGAPESKAFDEILRILFTHEEAELAIHMSFSPKPAHEIASACGIPTDEAEHLLESMADKAVIFSREKDGKLSYGLLPTVPGLFEFPLMRGAGPGLGVKGAGPAATSVAAAQRARDAMRITIAR